MQKRYVQLGLMVLALMFILQGCGGGGGGNGPEPTPTPTSIQPTPEPTPTEAPATCSIVGNEVAPPGPAVYETETCVSQGCFPQFLSRALRLESDGTYMTEQSTMLVYISGDVTDEPGCSGLLTTEDRPFILQGRSLDRGGVYIEVLQDCVGPEGLVLEIFGARLKEGTTDQYEKDCSSWEVHLPDDVQPLPEG